MILKPNSLIATLALICLLMVPAPGPAAEADVQGDVRWRCGDGEMVTASLPDGEINARGWFCPWCNRYVPPGPGREIPAAGCDACDPHFAPFNGETRFCKNRAILIVEGLLRMSDTPDLMAASIVERESVYEARIHDAHGIHVDTLQIHKANGWARSLSIIY